MNMDGNEYKQWLVDLKSRIRQGQIKAAVKINTELLRLYWDMGRDIVVRQMETEWGSGFLEMLSKDLRREFPAMEGFSRMNLYRMKKFYLFYNQEVKIVSQVATQLGGEELIVSQPGTQLGEPILQQAVEELRSMGNRVQPVDNKGIIFPRHDQKSFEPIPDRPLSYNKGFHNRASM